MIVSSRFQIEKPSRTFHEILLRRCIEMHKSDPKKMAMIMSDNETEAISFYEVYEYSMTFAGWLANNGFKKGDVLFLAMHNSWKYLICCLGAWTSGLVVSPASSQFTHYELNYQIKDSTAKVIVTDEQVLPKIIEAIEGLNIKSVICSSKSPSFKYEAVLDLMSIITSKLQNSTSLPNINMDEDLILLPYSSGTTGTPKGVMLSHTNYSSMLSAYLKKFDEDSIANGLSNFIPPEKAVSFLPFYHVMGLFGTLLHLHNGTTQIIMSHFNLKKFLQNIQDHKIISVAIVPAIAIILAESPLLDSYDLSSLLIIGCGSAPLGKTVIEKIKKRLPNLVFTQGYGMTEMSCASHNGSITTVDGSVGLLLPGTKMKIVSESGALCGPGEKGELWIKGPQVMRGYWRREEQTRKLIDNDGFMRTGDIAYFDENGYTFISDRIKELIKVNGKQVPPAELESIILGHPSVTDCCVIGIPNEKTGELPRAYVVSKGVTAEEIHSFVNERVAPYKQLAGGIEMIETIPRTSTGKLLRRQLKEYYLNSRKSKL